VEGGPVEAVRDRAYGINFPRCAGEGSPEHKWPGNRKSRAEDGILFLFQEIIGVNASFF